MDQTFFRKLKYGKLAACHDCVRRPVKGQEPWFGLSCKEHHSDGRNADIVWVMTDPGPEVKDTKRLCIVHNLRDPTSRNALRFLRKLGVGQSIPESELKNILKRSNPGRKWFTRLSQPERDRLKRIYPTNAVLHGDNARNLSTAAVSCSPIIQQLISDLSPKVILAFGQQAACTLFRIEDKTTHPIHKLWDGEPHRFLGRDTFFLFHHSQRGLANASKYVDVEDVWTKAGIRAQEILGWTVSQEPKHLYQAAQQKEIHGCA